MKRSLLTTTACFIVLTLLISSCSTQFPQYSGRYKNKTKNTNETFAGNTKVKNNRSNAEIEKIAARQAELPSNGLEPVIAKAIDNTTNLRSPSYTTKAVKATTVKEVTVKQADTYVARPIVDNSTGNNSGFSEGNQLLAIIIAIFLPFVGVAIYEMAITSHFWIALILTILFWLPGFIYALIIILGS